VKDAPAEGDAWILRGVSPSFLFAFGLLQAPALWLQHRPAFKAAQVLLFFALAVWARPRGCWRAGLGSVVFLAVTVAMNLAVPLGRVLLNLGPLKITQGALESGLGKGLTLVGLVYLSRLCVRPDLELPGTAGRYVARTFFYLNRLLELRRGVPLSRMAEGLDQALAALWSESPAGAAPGRARGGPRAKSAAAIAALGGLAAVNYGMLFL
jgi:heptaprenyl diphosphate synthase